MGFHRITSVGDLEINEILKKNPNISIKQAENLVIQRQLDLQSSKLLRDMMNEATIEYRYFYPKKSLGQNFITDMNFL